MRAIRTSLMRSSSFNVATSAASRSTFAANRARGNGPFSKPARTSITNRRAMANATNRPLLIRAFHCEGSFVAASMAGEV
jgi:hypothetical protein